MANRLATSTSPYLQQHADNPVDWYEWGEEAFAAARERDVPLLISVGYSACHWCHVMAHESFEDHGTAEFMNEHFVNVKVDREERPDVDAVYMAATQAMTGQGGWPMTVLATPGGEPFFCGTYFPPRPVQGMPSFRQVLASVAAAWTTRREEVTTSAATIRDALAAPRPAAPADDGPTSADPEVTARAVAELARSFDPTSGGFGGAPKFPPSMICAWLLRHVARVGADAAPQALTMAERTLEAMARGGLYDQLGGGFARYSVDARWVVPHFEKMLYDNALLLRVYTHWWRLTGAPLARQVVTATAGWLLRELRTDDGGFASALDADSLDAQGTSREGAFYVWSPDQLTDVLGPEDAVWAAPLLEVTTAGTFEDGLSVLQLHVDVTDEERDRWASVHRRLADARERRPRPARDDKVVAGWNGLAVAALAEAGALLEEKTWVDAARDAAELVLSVHVHDGRLRRTSRDGTPGTAPGVLEDYAHTADGLLALFQVTGEDRWFTAAGDLLDTVLARFGDGSSGFYDTAEDQTDPVVANLRRPRDVGDGPTPAAQPAAAGALLTYAALTGSSRHREAAEQALREPWVIAVRVPRAAGWALAVTEAMLDGPREVALVGPAGPERDALRTTVLRSTAPGLVMAVGDPDEPGAPVPLLADRPSADGRPTAYVCRGFVCDQPVTGRTDLERLLARRPT